MFWRTRATDGWLLTVIDETRAGRPGTDDGERTHAGSVWAMGSMNAASSDRRCRGQEQLKQSRAVATRYDRRGYVYLGTVTAAALIIWLRT
ncbi:hypothetical protein [Streptomyces sp. NBC_01591]|uniref:hypothetical protein n=1 Tax=Streptomyces sp. NBC_01591 TaxID=2975888 RepID=UPI003FA39641